MVEEKKKQAADEASEASEASESQPATSKKKLSRSPVVLAVSGLVAFIIFLGVFSFTMGVFDKKSAEDQPAEQPAGQAQGQAEDGEQAEYTSEGEDTGEDQIDFNFGGTEPDTLAELSWIEMEKKKITAEQLALAIERKQLETLKREVEALLVKKKQVEGERLAYLAKIFDGMKKDEISNLMAQLEDETIVALLPKMKVASASKVLAMLPPKRAAKITTMLLGLGKS